MNDFFQRLFDISKYDSLIERDRARMVYAITSFLLVLFTLYITLVPVGANTPATFVQEALAGDVVYIILMVGLYSLGIVAIWATRVGNTRLSTVSPVIMFFIGGVLNAVDGSFHNPADGVTLVLFVLLAGLLNRDRGLLVSSVVAIIVLAIGISFRANDPIRLDADDSIEDFFTIALEIIGAVGVTYLFLRFARLNRQEAMIRSGEERLLLAQITAQIAQRILGRAKLQDVLNGAVEQICSSYPSIYHAQIFLIDDIGKSAELVASTGEVGKMLIARHHTLTVGSQSVIGRVTATNSPMVARADSTSTVHRRNEFLPDTTVEAAFPLRIGPLVIGALDLQSTIVDTFREEDLPIFQALADNIAIAIDNARLFEEAEERVEENKRLVEQANTALRQVQRLNQRLTGRAWSDYVSDHREARGVNIDFSGNQMSTGMEWTRALSQTIQTNDLVQTQTDSGARVLAVPIRLRGQVIGAMEFELDGDNHLQPEQLELVQDVGELFSLSAENARLFEESQRNAQREAMVGEIAARIQSTNNVETMLSEAARGLKQTLKAERVAIRLGTPSAVRNAANGDEAPRNGE